MVSNSYFTIGIEKLRKRRADLHRIIIIDYSTVFVVNVHSGGSPCISCHNEMTLETEIKKEMHYILVALNRSGRGNEVFSIPPSTYSYRYLNSRRKVASIPLAGKGQYRNV